jgi:CubicO group peptidase (beta-lactamase class C family)
LMHQPGERWMYNTGSLLQGVLVRRASGRDLDAFVRERILVPLGMRDTGFHVPPEKLDRFAGCGVFTDPQKGPLRMDADGAQSAYATRPVFPSGGGGLVSTVDDYLAFARMLLAGGVHGGRRLLSAESVRQMTKDQLTAEQKAASATTFFPGFFDTHGWGYGVRVSTAPDAISQVPGRYGWFGGFGTSWVNDPTRRLVAIVMTQSSDFLFSGALDEFWRTLYAELPKA